jgi:predicted CopG family antitoxin
MQKKLTITIDERVYEGLHNVVGKRRISRFIESLVRPHVVGEDLDAAYRCLAADEAREAEALEWAESTIGDVADETRSTRRSRIN